MSDSSLLRKYSHLPKSLIPERSTPDEVEPDVTDDLGCFGYLRGMRERALMIQLRKRDGTILAVAYYNIQKMEFDPSGRIILHAPGNRIEIAGRNLNAFAESGVALFDSLSRHRVPWIQEADRSLQMQADQTMTVVESIKW